MRRWATVMWRKRSNSCASRSLPSPPLLHAIGPRAAASRRTALVRWLTEPGPMKSGTLLDKAKVTLVVAVLVVIGIAGTFLIFGTPQ